MKTRIKIVEIDGETLYIPQRKCYLLWGDIKMGVTPCGKRYCAGRKTLEEAERDITKYLEYKDKVATAKIRYY